MVSIKKSDIYIILPAFNEAPVINDVIKNIQRHGYENIVLIDDGSTDRTFEVAKRSEIKIIRHLVNRGQGAAIQTGIEYVRNIGGKYLVMIDSDGQFYPEDIEKLIKGYEKNRTDIVLGSRFLGRESVIPVYKRLFNIIANIVTFILSGAILSDTQTGFRLLNQKAVDNLNIVTDGYEFCSDMIRVARSLGLTISEVPVKVRYYEYANKKGHGLAKGQSFATGVETFFKLVVESLFR